MDAVENASGFDEAFESLYPQARSLARRLLPSLSDAEDAASEALARTLVRWDRVGALPYRTAWVLRVTTNVALDMLRRNRASAVDGERLRGADDLNSGVDDRVLVVSLISTLPRRQQQVLVLRHVAGLSEEETAQALGISRNSVKTHAQRGVRAARARGNNWGTRGGDVT
jgi:RNA polymerase sigma-70 factor (ECF subfamily)